MDNRIDDRGIESLAKALKENSSLNTLWLGIFTHSTIEIDNNNISDESAAILSEEFSSY